MRTGIAVGVKLFVAVACVVVGGVAKANDTAIAGVGGSFKPLRGEHPHVCMVRETVRITVGKEYYDTVADFIFQNNGPAATVAMGFPESGGGDVDQELYKSESAFTHFRTWIDGKRAVVRRVSTQGGEDSPIYEALWIKRVPFRRGERKKIRVSYRSPQGGSAGLGVARLISYDFTGGNWRSDVAESVLTVTLKEPGYYLVSAALGDISPSLARRGRTFTLRRTNWQAQASFVMRLRSTLPNWLNSPGQDLLHSADERFVAMTVPGYLPSPDRRDIDWLPSGLLRDGRVFVQLDYLRAYLQDVADKKRAGAGERSVSTLWIPDRRVIRLRAGRYLLDFQLAKKSVLVTDTRKKSSQTIVLAAPPYQQHYRLHAESPVTFLPLASVMKALNGSATYDAARRRFNLQVPDFT